MIRRLLLRLLPVLLLTCSQGLLRAQESAVKEIRVPYGLAWGDSVEKIRGMISGVKAKETACVEKSPGKVLLEAEGLGIGDLLLRKTLFTFRDGSLTEVEMQYGDPSWDGPKTVDFFDRTRRRIDERYGRGTLLVNNVRQHPDGENIPDGVLYTLIIYRWSQPAANLELDYYELQEETKACRLVSLHYKAP
jgi:hypothetical protein